MNASVYLNNLLTFFKEIEDQLKIEKDPLARCELAKGYCELGKELKSHGIIH
ncbi:hypothetical protein [Streptococcus sp. sy004]|uniref:hypothetical protein n=1 Tax=Streptococcus sp. sy004 TaxID=2600149 RepID=UPI0016497063|nr:hypothetical protein [Streptococcus sp. sy004]